MIELSINYYALVVAAVASMAIGFLWYGPLFGKEWMRLSGLTMESVKTMPLKPWQAMAAGLVNSLLIAYILSHFVGIVEFSGYNGIFMGFWIWLGFVATTQISGFLWEGKPLKLFLINTSYSLVTYLVMAAILVLWR